MSVDASPNLGWADIRHRTAESRLRDALWTESEVLSVCASRSRLSRGLVGIRTRGNNQRREDLIESLEAPWSSSAEPVKSRICFR
jgi:hypothetical protein